MVSFYDLRTVEWKEGRVQLIDQMKLPQRLSYVMCTDYSQVAEAIKRMVVRGAPAIGVSAAMALGLVAYHSRAETREDLIKELDKASNTLRSTRPTAVNLFWALERVLDRARSLQGSKAEVADAVLKEAIKMADEDVEANRSIGRFGASMIGDGDVVLTHCKWL